LISDRYFDAALAAVALDAGPVRLLVERRATGVEVSRLDEAAWCFAEALFDGWSVEEALASAAGTSADALLAEHLAAGRFVDFRLAPTELRASLAETREAASLGLECKKITSLQCRGNVQ
jgi:hypothetical protein